MSKPKLTSNGTIQIGELQQKCISQDKFYYPLECMGATLLNERTKDEGFLFTCMPNQTIIRVER